MEIPICQGEEEGSMIKANHRVAIYLRVSTLDQTTANQERELREVASRMGCEIVKVYRDHGVSGAKSRDERPQFDRLCRDLLEEVA
jgi:DNA invertase Pin-like site-specific DNA recombinase